jgi:phosphomannomutase
MFGSFMPEISRFYGIVIQMYADEHPPPHFHARYAGSAVQIGISPIRVLEGQLERRAMSLVLEWTALHQRELMENWNCMRNDELPLPIEPLH